LCQQFLSRPTGTVEPREREVGHVVGEVAHGTCQALGAGAALVYRRLCSSVVGSARGHELFGFLESWVVDVFLNI
jgi:hypothetical protein